jgi:hypothetical protein
MSHKRVSTVAAVMLAAAVGLSTGTASDAPVTRLPDADLFCPGDTLGPDE